MSGLIVQKKKVSVPASDTAESQPLPKFVRPVRVFGSNSVYDTLGQNKAVNFDIIGVKELRICYIEHDNKVSDMFVASPEISLAGMRDMKEYQGTCVLVRDYRSYDAVDFGLYILEFLERSLPDTRTRKAGKPAEFNKYYYSTYDKILFEIMLEQAAREAPGKYQVSCTMPYKFTVDGLQTLEAPWFRTLIPKLRDMLPTDKEDPTRDIQRQTLLETARDIDAAYTQACHDLESYGSSSIGNFWEYVNGIKDTQIQKYRAVLPCEPGILDKFQDTLTRAGQNCDTQQKADKWYQEHHDGVRIV